MRKIQLADLTNSRLTALASSMPIANKQRQAQQQAARDFALQQALSKRPVGASTTRPAQVMGGNLAQSAGEQAAIQGTQNVQLTEQLGQTGRQNQQNQLTDRIEGLKQGLKQQSLSQSDELSKAQQRAENDAFIERMQFRYDELGRADLNDRQLADYARSSGITEQQMQNYAQAAKQAYQMDITLMEQASRVLQNQLEFESNKRIQDQNQKVNLELALQKRALEEKIARKKAQAANNAQIFSTVGTIGGAVIGSAWGVPGASAGATIGGAVGGAAGNVFTDSEV